MSTRTEETGRVLLQPNFSQYDTFSNQHHEVLADNGVKIQNDAKFARGNSVNALNTNEISTEIPTEHSVRIQNEENFSHGYSVKALNTNYDNPSTALDGNFKVRIENVAQLITRWYHAFRWMRSKRPLKWLAIGFGLWSDLGKWCFCIIVPIALMILPLEIYLAWNTHCLVQINLTSVDVPVELDFSEVNLNSFFIRSFQILNYFILLHFIRKLKEHPDAICMRQAFELYRGSILYNVLLICWLIVIVISTVMKYYVPRNRKGVKDVDGRIYEISDVSNSSSYLALELVLCLIWWQSVIGCLLYGVVMKALSSLVDECLASIVTTKAELFEDYVRLHQQMCCKVASTFSILKQWSKFNMVIYIILLFLTGYWDVASFLDVVDYRTDSICHIMGNGPISIVAQYWFYSLTSFSIFFFNLYFPWHSTAYLRNSFRRLTQSVNEKTDWEPDHPFKERCKLTCFVQYAKVTENQSFINFTFISIIPYLSITLALSGLAYTIIKQKLSNML